MTQYKRETMTEKSQKAKVLILTTYPLVEPRHGGQIRANNLKKSLVKAGFEVQTIAYVEVVSDEKLAEFDKIFESEHLYDRFEGEYVPFINDLQVSKYVESQEVFDEFCNTVIKGTSIIHVEQPWLWPLAARYKKDINTSCTIIYGSANIESMLKVDILRSMTGDVYKSHFNKIEDQIDRLEKRAAAECDILVAVSKDEMNTISSWGGRGRCVLAPNGVEPLAANSHDVEKWKKRLEGKKFLLYAASAHPPNFVKFSELLGGSLGAFPPDCRLVVVGSVGEHIYHQATKGSFSAVNMSRLELVYQIPQPDLAALKVLASGFLLPIPYGGGTNLKTAEALQSGKPVIGTREAFRGFEGYSNAPNVYISSSPQEMHSAIRSVLTANEVVTLSDSSLETLSWSKCFAPLIEVLKHTIEEKSR